MEAEVGILHGNHYIRDFLKYYHIQYVEFMTAQEMITSNVPVLFCDTEIDLVKAVENDKFVLTNHKVLMQLLGKQVEEAEGCYYVMKDFVFGERSFYIDESVYCCDPSVKDVAPKLQKFIMDQEFFDVGETFSRENEQRMGACILAGRQVISLPWDLSDFDPLKKITLRPYYHKRSNRHSLWILQNVDFKGFRQLLLALLRYAYRRQGIWMPDNHAVNVKMGEQDIEFIYPGEEVMGKIEKRKHLFASFAGKFPLFLLVLLLAGMLLFTSRIFAAAVLVLAVAMCAAVAVCRKKAPGRMKYLLGDFAVLIIGINLIYNVRSLPGIYPIYRAYSQSRYQSDFVEQESYVDTLLQLLVKDKTVLVHDAGDAYEHPIYTYYEENDPQMKFAVAHDPKYYYGRDYYRFLEEFSGDVLINEALANKEEFDFSVFKNSGEMTRIGYSNDMARYVFLINPDEIEQSSYFWYDYVYREEAETMYVYLENEISANDKTLVALWDAENNLYIMSSEFYDKEVGK